jgi:hypothetical protein
MNTAQLVRIWCAVGVSVLLGIAVLVVNYFVRTPTFTDSGVNVYNIGAAQAWTGFALTCLVADGVLAGFTIYRMFRPIKKEQSAGSEASGESH